MQPSTAYEIGSCVFVVVFLGLLAYAGSLRFPTSMRSWVMLAFVEYMACAGMQLLYTRVFSDGGDAIFYLDEGARIANLLSYRWDQTAPEALNLLLQRPNAFDTAIIGSGTNTGSMTAFAAWLLYFLRGGTYASSFVAAGLGLFGALAIYRAFQDAAPDIPFRRLFVPTVLFPSVAFWTAALHKETLCVAGIGLVLSGWRAVHRKQLVRAAVWLATGIGLIQLFRAPAIPPVVLGLAMYVLLDRMQKTRGADKVVVGPVYLLLAAAMVAGAAFAVSRALPSMGIENVGDTLAAQQRSWAFARGASTIETTDDETPTTLSGQLLRLPLGLINALFRPQLFDVHNIGTALSAVEMTTMLVLVIVTARRNGLWATFQRVTRSPILLMCAVTTVLGCGLVGIVTFNLGSLARYRVPFLPFYGLLVSILAQPVSKGATTAAPARAMPPARSAKAALRRAS